MPGLSRCCEGNAPGYSCSVVCTGPYELLPEAWGAFIDALRADGHAPEDVCWEAYDTEPGPDVDPETLVTGLAVPVRDAAA